MRFPDFWFEYSGSSRPCVSTARVCFRKVQKKIWENRILKWSVMTDLNEYCKEPCRSIFNWWPMIPRETLSPRRLWGIRTFGSNIPVVPDLVYRLRAFVFEKFKRKSEKIGYWSDRLWPILHEDCLWQGIWMISGKNGNISNWSQHFSKPPQNASVWVLTVING